MDGPEQAGPAAPSGSDSSKNVIRRLIQVFSFLIIQNVILFSVGGTIYWDWAWIFFGVNVAILAVNAVVMPADLIAERGRKHPDAKRWDKILTSTAVIPIMGVYVVCGLDYRFGWTMGLPLYARAGAVAVYFAGSMGFTWAMLSNRYFSTQVRLQFDRDHVVETGGPYRFVRHPGYLAYVVFTPAIPLLLGSLWGLTCAAATMILFIVRTKLEDDTLQRELPGYADYAARVRYRILPGIW